MPLSLSLSLVSPLMGGVGASSEATDSVTYDGVTFNFDAPVSVYSTAKGEPIVVSASAFDITSITPAMAEIDGANANGEMQDPFIVSSQAFDEFIASGTGGLGVANTPYSEEISFPLPIAQGEETSIVKAVRLSSVTDGNEWQTCLPYVTLTVLASPPAEPIFKPSPSYTTKTRYPVSQLDWSVFRSITMPGSFPTLAAIDAEFPATIDIYGAGTSGEKRRRFGLNVETGASSSNYQADFAPEYAQACMVMHDDRYSNAQKLPLLTRIVEFGIQIDGLYLASGADPDFLFAGAGHGCGWLPLWVITAFALQDSAMLARAYAARSQLDQAYWVTQALIDFGIPEGDSGNIPQAWFQEHLGAPLFSATGFDSNFDSRYGTLGLSGVAQDFLAFAFLQNGPGGETGISWRLGGGANDNTNDKAAVLGLLDRVSYMDPYPSTTNDPGTIWRDMFDELTALGLYTQYTGAPDQAHLGSTSADYGGAPGDFFTGGDGQITWDYSAYGEFPNGLAITDRAVQVSLDAVQWIETEGVGNTGSLSSLMKVTDHYAGYRIENADGWGPPSQNYPRLESNMTPRNFVQTTGTDSDAAPSNVVAPVIHQRKARRWDQFEGNWKPVVGDLEVGVRELMAGVGYWDGYPAITGYTYDWLNGATSRGTAKAYDLKYIIDAGDDLTVEVTPDNGVGSPGGTTSAAITVPNPQAFVCEDNSVLLAAGTSANATIEIGKAHADRWLVVMLAGMRNNGTPNAVDIDGSISFTLLAEENGNAKFESFVQFWVSNTKVPSGTTATLNISGASSFYDTYAEVIRFQQADQPAFFDFDSAGVDRDADPQSLSVDVPASGLLVAAMASHGSGASGLSMEPMYQYPVITPGSGDRIGFAERYIGAAETLALTMDKAGSDADIRVIAGSFEFASTTPPTLHASVSYNTASGSGDESFAIPGTPEEGDLVLVILGCDNDISASGDGGLDSATYGYTDLARPVTGLTAGNQVAYKFMDASPDTNVVVGKNSKVINVIVRVFRGVSLSSPIHSFQTATPGSTGMPDAPSITTSIANCWLEAIGVLDDDNVAPTAPAGLGDLEEIGSSNASTTMVAGVVLTTAQTIDPDAFGGAGSDEWAAYSLALTPI